MIFCIRNFIGKLTASPNYFRSSQCSLESYSFYDNKNKKINVNAIFRHCISQKTKQIH